ncbi:RNA polymerase sigma factor [Ornithinibacillus halotolerans]|uniref:RNA polymerase sigma-70 factor (ECF subfamily) n=1 Tax=Ornithinibacillus halotolerans TaxID=1274357 RepID=A0A916W6W4_9BACI|nr:RNA polymerase sigma factor [Ornithinibacillus halotolerans]GGA72423.1 hypothetical protein GCM10008025_15270 [Ornithinibacillus halotolerans]
MQRGFKIQGKVTELYDEYHVLIFKYILKMTKDVQLAEDLTHDTFLKLFDYLLDGKEIDYPKTFIYRMARNVTIDYLRKKNPLSKWKDMFWNTSWYSPSVEKIVEIRQDSLELLELISMLRPPSYRDVVILRKVEGFSIRETAEILNWSESKVRVTLSRAMKKLEEKIHKGGVLSEQE